MTRTRSITLIGLVLVGLMFIFPLSAFADSNSVQLNFAPSSDWGNFVAAAKQYFNYFVALAVLVGVLMVIWGLIFGGGAKIAKTGILVVLASALLFVIAVKVVGIGNQCAQQILNNPTQATTACTSAGNSNPGS
jgi:hypothetical protein